jgi:hypothetical protein
VHAKRLGVEDDGGRRHLCAGGVTALRGDDDLGLEAGRILGYRCLLGLDSKRSSREEERGRQDSGTKGLHVLIVAGEPPQSILEHQLERREPETSRPAAALPSRVYRSSRWLKVPFSRAIGISVG